MNWEKFGNGEYRFIFLKGRLRCKKDISKINDTIHDNIKSFKSLKQHTLSGEEDLYLKCILTN